MDRKIKRPNIGAPTITDVARDAGFSPMTVSRVINGENNVRESTRIAIQEAVARLNYIPNLAARSLAGSDPISIAMLYGNPSAAYLSRLLVGSLEQAQKSHVQLVIEQCDRVQDINEIFGNLVDSGIDGIIVTPPLCDSQHMRDLIEQSNISCVIVANWSPPGKMSVVHIDDVAAAEAMTKHLISLGHRRIGFVKGNPVHKASMQRLSGYEQALRDADIAIVPELIVDGQFTYRSGLDAAEQLLTLPIPPTAIFASNDDMAAAAITVAHRRHLDVPRDVSICGFDDTDFALSIWPELTTIHQPIAEMSRNAVEILVERIRDRRAGGMSKRTVRLMDYTFIRRESDASPVKV
jgi:LacI family transcriptional regulator